MRKLTDLNTISTLRNVMIGLNYFIVMFFCERESARFPLCDRSREQSCLS